MHKLWQKTGAAAFWLGYPALLVYLRIGWRTRVVVAVGEEILLVKGWLGSGQWQLPGGGVHYKEDPLQAACRELLEETGVRATSGQLKPLYKATAKQHGLQYRYHCYLLKLSKKPALRKQAFEITDMAWLTADSITKEMVTAETYRAVQTWLQ